MSKLNKALELARMGFNVFPLHPNSKVPAVSDFTGKATTDEETITDWWFDPILEIPKDYNIGIVTNNLVVVDVDNKEGKNGDESLEELEVFGKEFPPSFEQTTPTGGRHIVYEVLAPVKQGVNVLGPGLDIRAKGGYIVGAGSTIDGKEYIISKNEQVALAPQWIIDACGKPNEKTNTPAPENINEENAISRALHYLKKECPPASSGERNHAAYKAACKVKDFGVDEVTCLELLYDFWPCEPMLDYAELASVVSSAYKYGNDPIGVASPEASFSPVSPEEKAHYLEEMNKTHALIYMEGSHFILHETVDEKGKPKRVFMNEASFKRKYSPFSLQKRGTYATEWLDWPDRREYAGVCFAPCKEPKHGYYNLWNGFACSPLAYDKGTGDQRKGLDMFLSHAKQNVCQGNESLFRWLIGYFAHMVQRPYERPLTTLVFRGSKGVGKNALIDRVGNLLGKPHYLVAHDGRYLTSNFNGHLDSCLCLVLDEAIWSGDKSAEGILKGITTAPTIMIERKGKEPYEVDNLVRLIIIGNESWLVPASTDERRYAVLDVGEGNKQQGKFFEEMRILIDEKGGNSLLLDYLLNFDLSTVNVNIAPKTKALLDQKISSLDPFEAWWFNCLSEGRIINGDFSGEEWPEHIDTSIFKNAFSKTCRDMNIRSRLPSDTALGMTFKKILPTVSKTKRRVGDGTVWVYKLPSITEARESWSKFVGQEVIWE
jgi:hypothetical protein